MTEPGTGRLAGKVALITGAGSGIGRATATRFAAEGATLVLNDLRGDRLEQTIPSLAGEGHITVAGDASNEDTAKRVAAAAAEKFGRADILVNNAGIYFAGNVTETTADDIERGMGVNFYSMIWTCKHVIPMMLKQGAGAIVNLGSISAFTGQENDGISQYLYNCSKAAVVQLTISMATRYAGEGIRVNSVNPGIVRTQLFEEAFTGIPESEQDALLQGIAERTLPVGRMTDPSEIASAILFLASDDASMVHGASLMVDGGFLAR